MLTWPAPANGTSDRRWLLADPLGSVIAVTNAAGAASSLNTYDEYGAPGASNAGRFQFTGAPWLAEAGLLHLRARAYDPALGRFLQTDPILTGGGLNLYAYVGNDPVNAIDPSGLDAEDDTIVVIGLRWRDDSSRASFDTYPSVVDNPNEGGDGGGGGDRDDVGVAPDEEEHPSFCQRSDREIGEINAILQGLNEQIATIEFVERVFGISENEDHLPGPRDRGIPRNVGQVIGRVVLGAMYGNAGSLFRAQRNQNLRRRSALNAARQRQGC